MEFEWDDEKSNSNLAKHGIDFEEAALIFAGLTITRIDDRDDYGETREVSIGQLDAHIIIVVVHTDRTGTTRLISARRANRAERKIYNDYCKKISQ